MIPKKIQPYFELTKETKDRDNNIIEGMLMCCNSHDFEVFVVGEIKRSVFSKMLLYPTKDKTVFEVRCKKCERIIPVFDSSSDGYGNCGKLHEIMRASTQIIDCIKCHSKSFSVTVKYEYPDIRELHDLEIHDTDNAFTWLWITIKCSECGASYRNFVNLETT